MLPLLLIDLSTNGLDPDIALGEGVLLGAIERIEVKGETKHPVGESMRIV